MSEGKSNGLSRACKGVLALLAIVGSLVAGVWAVDSRYTLKEIYIAGMEVQNSQTLQIQKNFLILNAEQNLRWKEYQAEKAKEKWKQNPDDPVLRREMDDATRDRCAAEKRWRDLKEGK